MSSGISEGSFNSASLAANELNDEYENKIYVVDTFIRSNWWDTY